ncbi:PorP/SprF family type IX secretion system membrane protein [Mucilaginibacter agri]|uniref:Type IX secretion system membrane protein PorP/SprF n=1 Tax=Mucilaginibacter agri TaxID=2695265 RepID=A0A965ZL65_9SPHI|nr:PorP/SprF family type IX secretion system membrane protein [Mucilaginibacter agri]NCD71672.1 type IX secretion system membrane protein PorP/SprF [Mucilaginibacter agri]
MRSYIKPGIKVLLLSAICFVFSIYTAYAQQDYTYSQYMNNQTPLNPAYSLLDKNGSLNALLRKQWVGIDGAPSSFIFNGNMPIESINGAAGATVKNDQFGIEHLTEVNAFFAKSIQLSEKAFLGVSLNAGFRNYVANYSTLDSNDPAFRDDVRQNKPNLGFGVMFYSDRYFIGVAVPELTFTSLGSASIQDNSYFRNHYNFSGAYLIDGGKDVKVKPAFLATYTKGVPFIANFSTTLYIKNVVGFGADYRTNNEMAGIISFMMSNFRLGYSYQFGTASNNIGRFNNSTHEVTLTYRFGQHLEDINLL